MMRRMRNIAFWLTIAMTFSLVVPYLSQSASAAELGNFAIQDTWERTDLPIAKRIVTRGWVWGPEALSTVMTLPTTDPAMPDRHVQYFDKGRIELFFAGTNADGAAIHPEIRNGLLASELITGRIQTGPTDYEQHTPSTASVAGDAGDMTGPTYATFTQLLDDPPLAEGSTVTQRLARDGTVSNDPSLARYNITTGHRVTVPNLDHTIAEPFWQHMNARGTVWEWGRAVEDALYAHPYAITGYPISEPYWARVTVAGLERDVLVQAFERRVLTYIPDYPAEWQVQHANSGLHYLEWRYGTGWREAVNQTPPPAPNRPGPPPPDLASLEAQLRPLVNGWAGQNAVAVLDLQTGQRISINGDRQQLAACSVKMPIMVAVAQDIAAGKYTADDVDYLVRPAMGPSANPPAKALIKLAGDGDIGAGLRRINQIMWDLGATNSIMTHPPGYWGEEYGYAASHGIVENYLTANDLVTMYANLWAGQQLPESTRDYFWWSLTIATPFLNGPFHGPLPDGLQAYHKIGVLYEPVNTWTDGGIVVFDRGGQPYAYAIAFLSSYNPETYKNGYWHNYTVNELIWQTFSE